MNVLVQNRFAFSCTRSCANVMEATASQASINENQITYSGCPENFKNEEIESAKKTTNKYKKI